MDDSREFPRVTDDANLSWRPCDDAEQSHIAGLQVNISGGGICFLTDEVVAPGTMLALELQLPGFPSSVLALARVVRCRPPADRPEKVEVGAEFHWIGWDSSAAQDALLNYVRTRLG